MGPIKKVKVAGISLALAFSLAACGEEDTTATNGGENAAATNGEEAAGNFTLESDVEFVVPYSAGGGSDTNARTIANIIQEESLIDKNIMVVNKPGGSGAVGNAYVYAQQGDPATISTFVSGQISSAILSDADVQLKDVTPIATLALDSFVLLVDGDSQYETVEDIIAAAEESPGAISFAGSGTGGEDHMVVGLLNEEAQIETKFVPFQGGGEALSALMGGHVDAAFSNPNEVVAQIEAGELRALATTSEEPLTAPLDSVPTFGDAGYPNVKFSQFRGIVGPPGMPEEAVAYWEDIFKQVSETEAWQNDYVKQNSLQPVFMDSEESLQFYQESEAQYKEILTELGLLK